MTILQRCIHRIQLLNTNKRRFLSSDHIAVILTLVVLSFTVSGCGRERETQSSKDAMINEMSNLRAFAKFYRIRPATSQGGNGSYLGLEVPPDRLRSEWATYEVKILSVDTVTIFGKSLRDTANTITFSIDGEGMIFDRKYTGAFRK